MTNWEGGRKFFFPGVETEIERKEMACLGVAVTGGRSTSSGTGRHGVWKQIDTRFLLYPLRLPTRLTQHIVAFKVIH